MTDYPESVPDRITITSTGAEIHNGEVAINSRTPGDREMRVVSPDQAQTLFGSSVESIDGVTVSNKSRYSYMLVTQPRYCSGLSMILLNCKF